MSDERKEEKRRGAAGGGFEQGMRSALEKAPGLAAPGWLSMQSAIAGGAGAAVGATLAMFIGHTHAKHLEQHLRHGGLLLWVRTHDADHENKALEILSRHSGEDVHLHTMTPPTHRQQSLSVRRPLVSFGPPA